MKSKFYSLLILSIAMISAGCSKNESGSSREGSPTVKGNEVTSITMNSAQCGGEVLSEGKSPVAYRGVVWSKWSEPTVELSTRTSDGSGLGTFTSTITGLETNTTYYVRAYATNEYGTGYGEQYEFTTDASDIKVTTSEVSNITKTSATCGGKVTASSSTISAKGVIWSTEENPTIELETKTDEGRGTGSFTSRITGLESDTRYYVRAYATGTTGTEYGEVVSFVTEEGGGGGTRYVDEKGIDRGEGITINGIIWAPVNCGYDETYTYGKLYQWGRKDGCGYNDGSSYKESVIQTASAGPVNASDENATKFYTVSSSPWDWLTPQDDTRWNSGTESSPVKTEYDPCPDGWRIPTFTEQKNLIGNSTTSLGSSGWDSTNGGYWFNGTTKPVKGEGMFLPASGYRSTKSVADYRGSQGGYWTSSISSFETRNASSLNFLDGLADIFNYNRGFGLSVRCVKE